MHRPLRSASLVLPFFAIALPLLAAAPPAAKQRAFVRTHDARTEMRMAQATGEPLGGVAVDPNCPLETIAAAGQPVDQGILNPLAFVSSAPLAGGRIAFQGLIDGSSRNQGIFRAENGIATPVAIGSGGGGGSGDPGDGSGDPSPIGGTFSGFFGGTFFAPAINAAGDVLFLADVTGGTSPRGLFLAHLDGTIENIAKVGGSAPGGGTFTQVGHGSINDLGVVAFVAKASVDSGPAIFRWSNGTLQKIAKPGTPAPGGGTFTIIVGETLGFVDGTTIPVGPLPDINNNGTIVFRTLASGAVSRGLVGYSGGVFTWLVKANTATPIGGTYLDMQGASINDQGEVCFYADVNLGGGNYSGGVFAGLPSALHKAMAFYDVFDGGSVDGLAFSRNPMQAIASDGSVVVWCDVVLSGGLTRGRIVRVDPSGVPTTLAQQGDPSSNGGTIGSIDAWPSIQAGFGATVSSGTPGAPNGDNAHQLAPFCGCLGDLSGNNEVGPDDLAILLGAWGGSGAADLDGDGTVDAADLAVLLGAWGDC